MAAMIGLGPPSSAPWMSGSDAPFDLTAEERLRSLQAFDLPWAGDDQALRARAQQKLSQLATEPLVDEASALRARTDLRVVTDDNMATEFKSDWVLFDSNRSWPKLINRLLPTGT